MHVNGNTIWIINHTKYFSNDDCKLICVHVLLIQSIEEVKEDENFFDLFLFNIIIVEMSVELSQSQFCHESITKKKVKRKGIFCDENWILNTKKSDEKASNKNSLKNNFVFFL